MPVDREITKPVLGLDQEPTAITWKSTLRSPTASPRGPHRSRSRTKSAGIMMSSLRSRTPSPATKSKSRESTLRKSSTGKLGASFSKSKDMQLIEDDYIKNLQQQIYFLELEANYLREQAKKATEMHPQMAAEAERMLSKLRALQSDSDDLQVELIRKDASLELVNDEKYKILNRLSQEENEKERMKKLLQDQLDEVKKERDRITMENVRLANQVERLMIEKENSTAKLMESQNIIAAVRAQLSEKSDQQRLTQLSLEDKRTQCVEIQARAAKIEEHYLSTTQVAHERQVDEYKNELRLLTQQLKEQERQVHDERYMKNKTQDDNEQMSKTNLLLTKQIDDLERQIMQGQKVRDELEISQTEDLMKLSIMSDKEKESKIQLRCLQQELSGEKERCNRYLTQLKIQEEEKSNLESANNTLKMELVENEARVGALEKENLNIRRDKEILTDHVADIQRQLSHKNSDLSNSRLQIRELEKDLNFAETERQADESMQSEKWREFETLAEGMKKLSRTMARTAVSTKSPRSTGALS